MLLTCPDCDAVVSSEALACPSCAYPVGKMHAPASEPAAQTRILQSDPKAAEKWEEVRQRIRCAEFERRHALAVLRAVAEAEEKQGELLEVLRDRAWETFSRAGCPSCRAHSVERMGLGLRWRIFWRGRFLACWKRKLCRACGHAW